MFDINFCIKIKNYELVSKGDLYILRYLNIFWACTLAIFMKLLIEGYSFKNSFLILLLLFKTI